METTRVLRWLALLALYVHVNSVACKAGEYGDGSTCTKCAVGKYGDVQRLNPDESHCQACGEGRYSEVEGASVCLPCQTCDVGTVRFQCGGGSAGVCANCDGGGSLSASHITPPCALLSHSLRY